MSRQVSALEDGRWRLGIRPREASRWDRRPGGAFVHAADEVPDQHRDSGWRFKERLRPAPAEDDVLQTRPLRRFHVPAQGAMSIERINAAQYEGDARTRTVDHDTEGPLHAGDMLETDDMHFSCAGKGIPVRDWSRRCGRRRGEQLPGSGAIRPESAVARQARQARLARQRRSMPEQTRLGWMEQR